MIGHNLEEFKREETDFVIALAGASDKVESLAHQVTVTGDERSILSVQGLNVTDDRDLPAVRGVTFDVAAGEILGVAGVDGNGQREMVEAVTGQRQIAEGRVMINGEDATGWSVRDVIDHDVAVITDDRHGEGLILDFNLERNAVLKLFSREPFSRRKLLRFDAIRSFTSQLVEGFHIKTPNTQVEAGKLSGGNQQKLVLARELSQAPVLIVANKPTRGLDIGAAAYVHQKLAEERERGAAILLISADLDELFVLSDRLMVMYNGQSMGVMPITGSQSGEGQPDDGGTRQKTRTGQAGRRALV